MSIKRAACIAGIYEHPTRRAPDKSLAQLHAEVAKGALADAGLSKDDVDGYFCAGDAPGMGPISMVDYLGLKPRHVDSTDVGGSSYLLHVAHAAEAIAMGKCNVALVTLAGKPRSEGMATGTAPRIVPPAVPDAQFEQPYAPTIANMYAMVAMRHMHDWGTTSEQLAWIKVAASHHAQHNPHALLRNVVTVEEVVNSPLVADPLHRLDCCVITDGGGAIIVTRPEIAKSLKKPVVNVLGAGEQPKHTDGGRIDLSYTGIEAAGRRAWEEAGVKPADMKYASFYDRMLDFVTELAQEDGRHAGQQRFRYWTALALLRGVMSSPPAGRPLAWPATKVPLPTCRQIAPSRSSASSALRRVARLIPRLTMSSRSGGSRSPGA